MSTFSSPDMCVCVHACQYPDKCLRITVPAHRSFWINSRRIRKSNPILFQYCRISSGQVFVLRLQFIPLICVRLSLAVLHIVRTLAEHESLYMRIGSSNSTGCSKHMSWFRAIRCLVCMVNLLTGYDVFLYATDT